MSIVRWSLACWIAVAVLFGSSARADDPLEKPKDSVAREHLQLGNKHYHVHELEKAIDEYKAGALREDAPVFLYNLGQCYRQLGNYDEAIWHYQQFLARVDPKNEAAKAVEEFVREMKAEREKKAMTQPPTEPASDGTKPSPPEPKQPTAPAVAAPTVATATTIVAHVERDDTWYDDKLGWAVASLGAVSVGVGTYFIIDARNFTSRANSEVTQSTRDQLRDKASSREIVGVIAGIGGVAILATGIVKLAIHAPAHREQSTSWNVALTGEGVQVFGSF